MNDFWRTRDSDKFEICSPGQVVIVIKLNNTYEVKVWDGKDIHLIMAWMPLPNVKVSYELIKPS